jgi:hypothetical protein
VTPEDDRFEAELATLLQADHRAACDESHPPPAGVVWWRAERRARHEAARIAARPTTVMQAVALACAAGVAVALLQFLAPWLRQWFGVAERLTTTSVTALALMALAPLVLVPLALYFALSDK